MKIKTLKFSLLLMALITVMISCKNDDDDDDFVFVEEDRTEQQVKDKDSILLYLSTHYYNSSDFDTGSNHKYTDIDITELPKDDEGNYLALPDPTNNTLLLDAVDTYTTEYLDVSYEYYVLNLNQGGGDSPAFTDIVRVRYEGTSVNDALSGTNEVFDSSVTPVNFNLQSNGISTSVIKAWQVVFPMFNAASGFDINNNGNGIVDFNNFGLGVMFMPSGLCYFSGTSTGSSYDNLIFKFELLQFEVEDHDNDGIPSYLEDLDNDLDITNDDTDEDGFVNFIDSDDDADGVSTLSELIPNTYIVDTTTTPPGVEPTIAANEFVRSRTEVEGIITIKTVTIADFNNDGTPDYLDENITIDYNE